MTQADSVGSWLVMLTPTSLQLHVKRAYVLYN